MDVLGQCMICGKPAFNTCTICGRLVCNEDYDPKMKICSICKCSAERPDDRDRCERRDLYR